MTIVKIIQSLDFGGIEKVFEVVAKYDLNNREQITFLVLGKGGAAETYIRNLGYRVIVLGSPTRIPQLSLIWKGYRFLTSERPDLVHCTGAEANFHGIIAAYMAGIPGRVAEEIGMPAHSRVAQHVFRQVFKLSHKVIAVAGPVKKYLADSKEAPLYKLEVIYNPVDVDTFLGAQIAGADAMERSVPGGKRPGEGKRIISVCRLHPIKNLDSLILAFSAAARVIPEPLEYWIIGDGEERGRLEKLVEELKLQGKVVFWGYKQDPSSYLAASDLFVLPSFSEGHPVSVIEAMLTGLPCIVTNVGGAPEFIEEGVNGWLMDPLDKDALAAMLSDILQMPRALLAGMGEKGRKKVLSQFRPEIYLKAVYSLYASVLPPHKK